MQRWSELSSEARNRLVADTIMEGELAPYSADLHSAYHVAEAVAFDKRGMATLHIAYSHCQGSRGRALPCLLRTSLA